MFRAGDKVRINPESSFFGKARQLPHGVIGVVSKDQRHIHEWIYVMWGGGHNTYQEVDLIKVSQFKGNK